MSFTASHALVCKDRAAVELTRMVRIACTIVSILCGLFAVVLVAQTGMVTGEANPANGVASFVLGFSSAVSLGFGDLFTPDNEKFQILLNNGSAAIVWMASGAVVTTSIRRFAPPTLVGGLPDEVGASSDGARTISG